MRKSGPAKLRSTPTRIMRISHLGRPLDHAREMTFRHVMHSHGSGGSATLSVTDNSRWRGGDQVPYTGNVAGNRRKSVMWDTISVGLN
jgi:hypothetical protein